MSKILLWLKPIFHLTLVLVAEISFAQTSDTEYSDGSVIISSVNKETLCAGDELIVQVKWVGSSPIPPPYITYIQLSDTGGNFSSFTNIGSSHKNTIICVVPSWIDAGKNYKMRAYISQDAPNTYSIYPKPIIISRQPPQYIIEGNAKACVGTEQSFLIEIESGHLPKWSVMNGAIVDTLLNGVIVKWSEIGKGSISVISQDNSCGIAQKTILEIDIESANACITNVDADTSRTSTVVIHRNENNNSLELETNFSIINISVLNYTGQELQKSVNEKSISLTHIPSGLYLLKVEGNKGETVIRKFWR